jgi:RimJ/RimL family protein N-acetyltransferase
MQTCTTPTHLAALRPLFNEVPVAFFLEAMIHGNCAYRAWAADNGRSALLWETRSILFAVGDPNHPAFQTDLAYLFGEIILPSAQSEGRDAFLFHTSSQDWDGVLAPLLPGYVLNRYPRILFEGAAPPPADWRAKIPPGFELRPIDRKLLAETSLEGHAGLVEEIEECWPSRREFLAQGFGIALLDERRIVCRITGEYAYPGHIGIGILSDERYRGKGLATLATYAFLEVCAEKGIEAHWEAWKNNLPSVRVAEKAGFLNPCDYSVLVAYRPSEKE